MVMTSSQDLSSSSDNLRASTMLVHTMVHTVICVDARRKEMHGATDFKENMRDSRRLSAHTHNLQALAGIRPSEDV
jgi:hypothetical protein